HLYAHPALLSFPTRRSSDLPHQHLIACRAPQEIIAQHHRAVLGKRREYHIQALHHGGGHARNAPTRRNAPYYRVPMNRTFSFHQDRKSTRLNSSHVAISYAV